jgi:glycosyltransferase involved in cell wall biosynthesis
LRRKLHIPAGWHVALYLGGLAPGRGLEELVRSSAHLEGVAIVLLGPGEPSYRRRLQDLAPNPASVRLAPAVSGDEVPRWAAAADLGVVPYPDVSLNHRYALPTKLFEYLSAGLPVVASDLPEIRGVLSHYDVGATFDAGRPEDIARAIEDILADPPRLGVLRRNARRAHEELNWDREGARLLELVQALA